MKFDKNKLLTIKNSFLEKKYSQCEHLIEELGSLEKLPHLILNFYVTSKLLNKSSKKEDYLVAAKYLEKIYSANTNDKINLYNLIIASINANHFKFVEKYLHEEYEKNF